MSYEKKNEKKNIWWNLNHTFLTGRSQYEKTKYSMILTIWHFGKGKTLEGVEGSVVARAWGEGGMKRHSTENF